VYTDRSPELVGARFDAIGGVLTLASGFKYYVKRLGTERAVGAPAP